MRDPRMALVGLAAWAGALAGTLLTVGWAALVLAAALVGGAALARRRPGTRALVAALLSVLVAVGVVAVLRAAVVRDGPVADLAAERAVVDLEGTVVSDPRPVQGAFEEQVVVRLDVDRVVGRGRAWRLSAPVVVLGGADWAAVPLGARVSTSGRLAPSDSRGGDEVAALLVGADAVATLEGPDVWWRGAAGVRASLRAAVEHRPAAQRVLVPALVVGDDAGLDPGVAEDFRTTGLTHLTAVSGTNLTLVVGFVLLLARWVGVRGRWLVVVGALGIVGFVLLARTEPSVVRAAAMGAVGLLGLGRNGRQRGFRALGVAVTALLLVSPGLATTVGFALSVLATAGILVLAPTWRDALRRWLPRWAAEAVAVPAAAQLACTPLVAAVSGQVSLVAVVANLLVAPVVGPATVLGLVAGLVGLVWPGLATVIGTLAAWCVAWIVLVARRGADLPTAAVAWGTGPLALVVLVLACAALALLAPRVLRSRALGPVAVGVVVLVALVRLPTPGWPPPGWVLVACDVGQGDALVLRTGPGAAVVVDAGPDAAAVDRCLTDLGVEQVPLVVLTHFHADHVDGLAGVLEGRRVDRVEVTSVPDPPGGVQHVQEVAAEHGVAVSTVAHGATSRVGEATLQVLWPPVPAPPVPSGASAANDASVVLLVEVRGVRMLLTGDLEPTGQAVLAAALPGLRADVLKLPHHGSAHQDEAFLESLAARLVLVSVGQDNTYGHPSPQVVSDLERTGARVLRTDLSGDLAVVVDPDGALGTLTHEPLRPASTAEPGGAGDR
ncbi:ComEC/Rec2 family competence protein [Nocardioides sp. Leaf285]|uniref:ComEC/Rec2 family competence protein n=1 Tax=Nocardioides sp. Leaf285 TaxID=1736322 RepID=UPI001F20ED7C|nr:ComEC/Rec2 family competence protein [Nocardioides sp. Leaf285]